MDGGKRRIEEDGVTERDWTDGPLASNVHATYVRRLVLVALARSSSPLLVTSAANAGGQGSEVSGRGAAIAVVGPASKTPGRGSRLLAGR